MTASLAGAEDARRSAGRRRVLGRLVRWASALIAVLGTWAAPAAARADVTFSGPLGSTGAKLHAPAETAQFSLASYGYTEQEYLASGTAQGNSAGYPQSLTYPATPFTTRIIVRRPLNAKRSNGTVVLEWMNVSLQQDTDVDWIEGYRELMHAGFTYVAVSVQPTGVPLASEDPVRYGQIHIPPFAPERGQRGPVSGRPVLR